MTDERPSRVVIDNVRPEVNGGRFPVKRAAGENVIVSADIFADGHDTVSARLVYGRVGEEASLEVPMRPLANDRWQAEFSVAEPGTYWYTIRAWINHFRTWQRDLQKKKDAGRDVSVDLDVGAGLLEEAAAGGDPEEAAVLRSWAGLLRKKDPAGHAAAFALSPELEARLDRPPVSGAVQYGKRLPVLVERERAAFGSWYELFPRSCGASSGGHGTLRECESILPEVAGMGFDIVYLPPVHPIGETARKGRNNTPGAEPGDPGSPWAIGSAAGGHKSVHPDLGTLEDFEHFVAEASRLGLEVALDLAFQCSPDHPYVKEHPEWFKWRPDGTIQFAENPPKTYEDIVPFDFETAAWRELWEELKSVVLFWAGRGVRIFRADNPHTKPFAFWEWLIAEVRRDHPDVLFLSEAFPRPKVMYRLAKVGFSQSYTYFTWRNTKREITEYLTELTRTEVREFFRPNFWPNTPDILPEFLQLDGRPAFVIRLALAATLSSSYGIYGPVFELGLNRAAAGREEYLDSEKYEVRDWSKEGEPPLRALVTRINRIRRENRAFHSVNNLRFFDVDNDSLIAYGKATDDLSNIVLVVVNLDPFHVQSGWVTVPVEDLGVPAGQPYLVFDLISQDKYLWQGGKNYVELHPDRLPIHIFRIHKRLRRETDFDYFM